MPYPTNQSPSSLPRYINNQTRAFVFPFKISNAILVPPKLKFQIPKCRKSPKPSSRRHGIHRDQGRQRQTQGNQVRVQVSKGRPPIPRRPRRSIPQDRPLRPARRLRISGVPLSRPRIPRRRGWLSSLLFARSSFPLISCFDIDRLLTFSCFD